MTAKVFSVSTDTMLQYFLSTIEVRVATLEATGGLSQSGNDLLIIVKGRLNALKAPNQAGVTEDTAWTEAYSLERLLATFEPQESLIAEVRRRIDEAAVESVAATPRLRTTLTLIEAGAFDTSKTPPEYKSSATPALRGLLMETLEELHWTMQRRYVARPFQKTATRRIVWCGFISFCFLVIPYVSLYIANHLSANWSLQNWAWLPLYTALTAGVFGAAFSRLLFLQQNMSAISLSGLKNAAEATSILLRGIVGMCGALVIFFFLQSGLAEGQLFPKITELGLAKFSVPFALKDDDKTARPPTVRPDAENPPPANRENAEDARAAPPRATDNPPLADQPDAGDAPAEAPPVAVESSPTDQAGAVGQGIDLILPTKALALLVIWCFLAGFSERLVPSILSSTEEQFSAASKAAKT